ncbi:MAG: carbohydrate ABC transporter permease [Candidatus Flexifilum sp.]|jgi:ABC-type sugar transport system permease subunit
MSRERELEAPIGLMAEAGAPSGARSEARRLAAAERRGRVLRAILPYLYLAPALIAIGLFVYVPLVRTVQLSFYRGNLLNPMRQYVGLENYLDLLGSPLFGEILWHSAVYMIFALIGSVVVPVSLALLTLQLADREVDFYQSALFVPTVIAFNVVVIIWAFFFLPTPGGLFNQILARFGVPPASWLRDTNLALPAIALIANWKLMGFHFLFAIAGLKAIPRDYLEAAYVDGASGWPLMRHIVLPLFAPTGLFLIVITLISALDVVFTPIRVLTEGGPNNATNNLMYAIYSEGFRFFRLGEASTLSVVLIALFGGLIYLQYRSLDRRIHYDR